MLNFKNNKIKYNKNNRTQIYNQLIINAISILTIAFIYIAIYLIILKNKNNNFSIMEISRNQNIYIDKKSIFNNKNQLDKILKHKKNITFKVPNNINYNILCRVYNQVKKYGFKNIIFTKN